MAQLEITLSQYGMERSLAHIWHTSFGGGRRETDLFFRSCWRPENGLVLLADGKPAAALYLLPCRILLPSGPVQAHYLYAAATLPQYRGRGYMGYLLEAAARYGQRRGDAASVLLPGEPSLYEYYHRFGYRTVFGVREWQPEPDTFFQSLPREKTILTPRECAEIRSRCLEKQVGSVLWDVRSVQFALWVQRKWGQGTVFTKNGYGLFTRKGMVQELMALPGEEKALLLQMQRAVSPHTLTLRLPVKSPLFPGKGTVCPHGMLRPLCREVVRGFPADGTPYLGLTME